MVDVLRYNRLKPKGLVKVVKSEEGKYFLAFKRFSVEDSTEIDPEKQEILMEELQTARKKAEESIVGVNEILEEIVNLENPNSNV